MQKKFIPMGCDFWNQKPLRCEVWSEKGTVCGVLAVGFRVMHGFSGATTIHDVSEDDDGREVTALYVGDFDPSGLFMSEEDLPSAAVVLGAAAHLGARP